MPWTTGNPFRPLADRLGREEGFEQLRLDRLFHSASVVPHRQGKPTWAFLAFDQALGQGHLDAADAAANGVDRVVDEVDQHLVQLRFVRHDEHVFGGDPAIQCYGAGRGQLDEAHGVADRGRGVNAMRLERFRPAEQQHLADDVAGAAGGAVERVQLLVKAAALLDFAQARSLSPRMGTRTLFSSWAMPPAMFPRASILLARVKCLWVFARSNSLLRSSIIASRVAVSFFCWRRRLPTISDRLTRMMAASTPKPA